MFDSTVNSNSHHNTKNQSTASSSSSSSNSNVTLIGQQVPLILTNQSTTPNDCLSLFSSAISSQPGSLEQRRTLNRLKDLIESNPSYLPILYPSLLSLINSNSINQVYRRWVSSIIVLAICRPNLLPTDQRLSLILQSTETIHRLVSLQDPADPQLVETKKLAIQAFSSAYPILFKHTCTRSNTTNDSKQWGLSNQIKGTILALWRNDNSPLGIRLAGNKFVQRVIQVGTRGAVDPRKRNEDPSIVMCGSSSSSQQHPYLKPKELEQEANNLLEESIRSLFQTKIPELASAIVTSLGLLIRLRQSLSPLILSSLVNYNPSASPLATQSISTAQLKGAEKTLRITLSHLDRATPVSSFSIQIREALMNQTKRLEEMTEKERERKRQRKEEEMAAKKRSRTDRAAAEAKLQETQTVSRMISMSQLPGFDVTSLPVDLVVELVIANLQVLTDQVLCDATAVTASVPAPSSNIPDKSIPANSRDSPYAIQPGSPVRPTIELVPPSETFHNISSESLNQSVKPEGEAQEAEGHDNVNNDEDDDRIDEDLVLEPLNDGLESIGESPQKSIFLDNWQIDQPIELTETSRKLMIRMTLDRISQASGVDGVSSMLLARLVTRGMGGGGEVAEEVESRREDIRRMLFNFVVADFSNRMHFARVWLIEEWLSKSTNWNEHNTQNDSDPINLENLSPYDRWLSLILDYIVDSTTPPTSNQTENLKQTLSYFLLDLPYIPERELSRLNQLCQDPKKLAIGFTTLRDLTSMRPTLRNRTLDVLLGLSTHSQRQTRNAAIMSVKSWVMPNGAMKNLGDRVVSFAVQLLQELEKPEEEEPETIKAEPESAPKIEDVEMEDGETTELEADESSSDTRITFAKVENATIVSGLSRIKTEDVVIQHLELLLSLSVKNPDLLDHLFRTYPNMLPHVQESVNKLITPLIRTLGGKHGKIISLIQNCQPGSEALILRVLSILTEKGKLPASIVEVIKSMSASSNNLSPRFIIPTIGDLTKAEIMHHVPRIITLLNGSLTERGAIRSVFESIVQQPPSNFGSVSTNAPRVKHSELLTPVELLVLLHRTEEGGYSIKQAIEAIGICFSMTEIFKPEILAAFMQQVVDELTLPTLFLRTVIQAVQTYKSLQAFVSTTLLSRLILKKIWVQPQLWEGFMRCAKIIAPHSFGALLQLPRDQLKELVMKQSGLKGPLREYVNKKAGNNKSRVANLMEILSDPIDNNMDEEPMTLTAEPLLTSSIPNNSTNNSSVSQNGESLTIASAKESNESSSGLEKDEKSKNDDENNNSNGENDNNKQPKNSNNLLVSAAAC
ncbi:Symplekin tight junction protein C terminal-domain-containing protein [Phakopsora pachyrhizi]|nr:Symplekin tight junction protein C terminal-domain-containing protein [Phakopsora pachyrhizi]